VLHVAGFRSYHYARLAAILSIVLVLLAALAPTAAARSQPARDGDVIFGLTRSGEIVVVNRDRPGRILSKLTLSGLADGEGLVGIDVRPATGQLYGVGNASQLYTIDVATGVATPIGAPLSPGLQGDAFGVDFNPVADRLRVVSNTGQNLRINPDTGAVTVDGSLAFAVGDANAGTTPHVTAAAYTNSIAGATATTLYTIDVGLGILATQNPPNDGTLNTVGRLQLARLFWFLRDLLRLDDRDDLGFDIVSDGGNNEALVVMPLNHRVTFLMEIDLANGNLTGLNAIGGSSGIVDIAVAID
jgi:hypothetical protein